MKQTIFVTGATGLVGSRLIDALRLRGDRVIGLSRRFGAGMIQGDPGVPGPWLESLQECDAVIHLAGANIFSRRWSDDFMKVIRDSRVCSTELIAKHLPGTKVKTFVSCSAIGYYGDRGDDILTEDSMNGSDFMADVCREWESAAEAARGAGIRVVHPRLGIVLDPLGGAIPKLVRPYRFMIGGRIGSGRQYTSWIHHADLTNLLLFILNTQGMVGPVNATSPNPATNEEMGRTIARVLNRPHWLPVPGFALRIALGRIAESLLGSQRVMPTKALEAGFEFRFPALEPALRDVLGRNR